MDKKTIFNGTSDMWETIIDNLLNNFMRYASNQIKITIKSDLDFAKLYIQLVLLRFAIKSEN